MFKSLQADVGIAMGGGVDAASEVADVVLLGDRVPQVGAAAAHLAARVAAPALVASHAAWQSLPSCSGSRLSMCPACLTAVACAYPMPHPLAACHTNRLLPTQPPLLTLPQVLDVLQLSRATLRKIQQNMWCAEQGRALCWPAEL